MTERKKTISRILATAAVAGAGIACRLNLNPSGSVQTEINNTPTPIPATWTPEATVTPEATATAEVIATRQVEQEITFPNTPQEAATLFGATADRWELSVDGGWHLIEDDERTVVNPAGFVLEGYYDQNPGKNPRQFVATVAIEAQGATIWNLNPQEAQVLFDAMAQQKGYTPQQADLLIDRVGWNNQ